MSTSSDKNVSWQKQATSKWNENDHHIVQTP
jgi:hypothetical protein